MEFDTFFISGTEKIVDGKKPFLRVNTLKICKNERFSFQLAYCNKEKELFLHFPVLEVDSPIKDFLLVRTVEEVPCTLPFRKEKDDWYSNPSPALVPDILKDDAPLCIRFGVYQSICFTYLGGAQPGTYPLDVTISTGEGETLGKAHLELLIADLELPTFNVHYSNWVHYDGIASYYGLKPFSEDYLKVLWSFVDDAVLHQMDTLLVPLLTPALDTNIGGERLTTQLLEIEEDNGSYSFNYDKVLAFMDEARLHGIRRFEMSHLFTQWGAEHAPKVALKDGKKIFGWETDSDSSEYLNFLKRMLSGFTKALRKRGYDEETVFFHLSDEPNQTHLARYLELKEAIKPALGEYKTCDALSNVEFASEGAVEHPICALEHVKDFQAHGIKDYEVYYCSAQTFSHMSNRLLSMPLQRTRIIGCQLYLSGAKGLLHWGFNFYNSAFSKRSIDPYLINDADGSFPSGDSFIVYPKKDGGVYDSLRHEAMCQAFNDYRLLNLLQRKIGREQVCSWLEDKGLKRDFLDAPTEADWLDKVREEALEILEN